MTTFTDRVKRFVELLELAGAVATSVVMFGCFAFGLTEICGGLLVALPTFFTHTNPSNSLLVTTVLIGLEKFFLAPLPFLAFISTTRLYRAMTGNDPAGLVSANELVVEVKRLITGLMIAVVSTELIHRIVGGSELTSHSIVATLGLIATLSLYYFASCPKGSTPSAQH